MTGIQRQTDTQTDRQTDRQTGARQSELQPSGSNQLTKGHKIINYIDKRIYLARGRRQSAGSLIAESTGMTSSEHGVLAWHWTGPGWLLVTSASHTRQLRLQDEGFSLSPQVSALCACVPVCVLAFQKVR